MERDAQGNWLPCKLCGSARPHGHKWGVGAAVFWSPARIAADIAARSEQSRACNLEALEYADR
jgi:hypothetical protein